MKNSINDKTTMVKEVSNIPDSILKELSKITDFNSENGVHVLSVDADTFEQSDMSEGLKQLIRSAAPEGFLKSVKSSKNTVDPTITPTTTQPFASAERYTGLKLLQDGEYGTEYVCKTDGDLYNTVVIRQQCGGYINKRTGAAIVVDNTFLKGKFVAVSKEREGKYIDGVLVEEVSMDNAITAYKNGSDAWVEFVNPCFCGKCSEKKITASFENDLSPMGKIEQLVESQLEELTGGIPSFILQQGTFVEDMKKDLASSMKEDRDELRLHVDLPLDAITDGKFFIKVK